MLDRGDKALVVLSCTLIALLAAAVLIGNFAATEYSLFGDAKVTSYQGAWGDYLGQGRYEDGVYTTYTANGAWRSWGDYWLNRAAGNPVGTTCRLAFRFWDTYGYRHTATSAGIAIYDESKMDDVVNLFDGAGVLVILDLHQGSNNTEGDSCTDDRIKTYWEAVADHYSGDARIAAFDLFNEPEYESYADLVAFYHDVADLIWAKDATRKVIMPFPFMPQMTYTNWSTRAAEYIAAVTAEGGLIGDGRVMFDICHPYYFEHADGQDYDMGKTVVEKVAWYDQYEIAPCVAAFGAANCWMGETFLASADTGWNPTPPLQAEWLRRIVWKAESRNVPIQACKLWGDGATVSAENASLAGLHDTLAVSSYPRDNSGLYSTSVISNVITTMENEKLGTYRMSIGYEQSTATRDAMIAYYIANSSDSLIVCRHKYDPGGSLSAADWADIQTWCLDVCSKYSASRVSIEPVNECGDSDLGTRMQTLVTAIRAAGYGHRVIFNKWTQSWSSCAVSDPLGNTWCGYHYYFNTWSVSNAEADMTYALAANLKVFNTEIGADYNEASSFDSAEVQEVNQFMDWCYDRGIGNAVWMRYGLENYPRYQALGLDFPPLGDAEPNPLIQEYYYVTTSAGAGGQVSPLGTNIKRAVGATFYAVAAANIDYKFRRWLLDGAVSNQTGTMYILDDGVANAHYTLKAEFTYNPPTPPPNPNPPDTGYWTINIGEPTGGTVSPAPGEYEIEVGETLPLSVVTVDDNYRFTYWLKDGAYYSAALTLPDFTAGDGDQVSMLAVFQKVEPPPPGPVPLGPEPVGRRSSMLFEEVQRALQNEKPLEFDDFVKAFKRGKF